MKRIVTLSALFLALLTSCGKDEECTRTESPLVAPASEVAAIQAYLTANSLTATQDPSGVFYNISAAGTGTATPGLCSEISVKYKGSLTNGNVFDDSGNSAITFPLGDLIVGWQKVIPKLKKGGKMKMYVPPTLAYGTQAIRDQQGNIIIPAGSTLVFDIELVNF